VRRPSMVRPLDGAQHRREAGLRLMARKLDCEASNLRPVFVEHNSLQVGSANVEV